MDEILARIDAPHSGFTPTEQRMLRAFLKRPDGWAAIGYLLYQTWGYGSLDADEKHLVRVNIYRLRHKLARLGCGIENDYGTGQYRLYSAA